jgi:hypothetical protein
MVQPGGFPFPGEKRDLRVLVDTSSWMHEHAEEVLGRFFAPLVHDSGQKLVVPLQVVEEIKKHLAARDPDLRQKAERAHDLLSSYRAMGLADIFSGSEQTFADNVMQLVIMRFCEKYHFCLITQDRGLATDALRLGQRQSVTRAKSVVAVRLGDQGSLDRWELDPRRADASWRVLEPPVGVRGTKASQTTPDPTPAPPIVQKPRFRLRSGPPRSESQQLPDSSHPGEGDFVLDSAGRRLRLTRRIGSGGEGAVFATDGDLVCKLYEGKRLTTGSKLKIELMLQKPVQHRAICWPRSLAMNQRGEYVGYLMPAGKGKELQRTIFVKPLLQSTFPRWTRLQLATLAASILEPILELHERNVLLGDINPLNILVLDENTVFFVDTDSYQVEDFPCPVGTATFLTPDLLGQNLATVLRGFPHELFAVATLVFMILVPGKPPYSHMGGGDPAENVRARQFPYGFEEKKAKGVPAGPWRFIWSHLPFYLKEAFHDVFSDGERPTTDVWLKLMRRYQSDLSRGHVSEEIFPTTFKRLRREDVLRKGGVWLNCLECTEGFGSFEAGVDLCPDCRNKETQLTCFLCDRQFMTRMNRSRSLSGRKPICHECQSLKQTAFCKDCGQQFELTAGHRVSVKEKGHSLPKRCKNCREQKRAARGVPPGTSTVGHTSPPPSAPSPSQPSGGGFLNALKRLFGG